ncbi:hypothetical protein AVEN_157429-1 [Araneus ventricosus]|uniref:Secreted protein n=1 Tax=Araneus ventricosus TaxID=182803 RepID=A0A4Y2KDY9_ARAVE|nr:hypothetical protein AVEN_157429-1 [Araneus ventricosus]
MLLKLVGFIMFSLVMLTSRFEATRELFWDGPRNFNHGQMKRTTPDLAPSLQTPASHQREGVCPLRMIYRVAGQMRSGSSVEMGLEPVILRHRGRNLTTRPPRP